MNWIKLIFGICSIVGICFNFIQWYLNKTHRRNLTFIHQATYNVMDKIRYQVNLWHRGQNKLQIAEKIDGLSAAAQFYIVSFSKTFGFIPEEVSTHGLNE